MNEPLTALADVNAALARLDASANLGAVVARDDDAARAAARDIDASWPRRLRWAALTVKDWIDVDGLPCEGVSGTRTGRIPERDATAVARLKAAGAVVVAKTQPGATHAFHGDCFHPIDPTRSPGASSSGEAALIGAGASLRGLGSDSGGSIRLPAAWCGVFGLKPSFGLVPSTGHWPRVGGRADGRSVIGPMASSVRDAWTILRVIAGPDGRDGDCAPVRLGDPSLVRVDRLRVAVVDEDAHRPATSTADAIRRAADALRAYGTRVMDTVVPPMLDESLDITMRYWTRTRQSGDEVDRQLQDWDRFTRRVTTSVIAQRVDVILSPCVADVAPPRRDLDGADYLYTLPWSLTGWPAISVPYGTDPVTGLPLAVQVIAPRWNDHVAIAVAAVLHRDGAP